MRSRRPKNARVSLSFFFSAKANAEKKGMTLKQVMSAGTELGGPKPYEENLNLMSCKMSSASPTQAVGNNKKTIGITVLLSMGRRVSFCEIKISLERKDGMMYANRS